MARRQQRGCVLQSVTEALEDWSEGRWVAAQQTYLQDERQQEIERRESDDGGHEDATVDGAQLQQEVHRHVTSTRRK